MTISAPVVVNQLSTRLAAIAVTLLFVVNGVVIGGFGGSLPSLRDKLGLDSTEIAIMLFCAGMAAILSMQIGGRVADAIGAREVSLAAMPLLIVGMITIGLAPAYPVRLPDLPYGMTLTSVEVGPGVVRVGATLPVWRFVLPRAVLDEVINPLSVVGRPLDVIWPG